MQNENLGLKEIKRPGSVFSVMSTWMWMLTECHQGTAGTERFHLIDLLASVLPVHADFYSFCVGGNCPESIGVMRSL